MLVININWERICRGSFYMYSVYDTSRVLWTSEDVDIQYHTFAFNPLNHSGYCLHYII
jgi:hypothetical protein